MRDASKLEAEGVDSRIESSKELSSDSLRARAPLLEDRGGDPSLLFRLSIERELPPEVVCERGGERDRLLWFGCV